MTPAAEMRIEVIDEISYRFVEGDIWPYARDHAAEIDAHWQKRLEKNPHLYNGRVLLMHPPQRSADGRCLEGTCFSADFKSFTAWRDMGCPDRSRVNLFAMAALRTSDGAFLLGEMGPKTASTGSIYFPAGTPDHNDLNDGALDLEGSVWRELTEETGFRAGDVVADEGWTVVSDGAYVACMKMMHLPYPAAEAVARVDRFLAQETDPELARVIAMSSPADFVREHMPAFMCAYLEHMWTDAR
jgi:hypothetical protein